MHGHTPLRTRLALAGLGAAGLVLVAGCGVAPAGADIDSPAIGPTSAVSPGSFPVFPVPGSYAGYLNQQYTTLQKTVTGTSTRNIHLDARSNLVFWLSCLGATSATANISSPDLGLNWTVPCGTGHVAEPQAINFVPTTGIATGTQVKVLVSVTAGARWEVRIDAPDSAAGASSSPSPGTSSPAPSQTS